MPLGMSFADIAAILTEINKMATGQEPASPIVDTSSFVSQFLRFRPGDR